MASYFDSLNLSSRADMTAHEGRVVKYDSVSRHFRVKYSDGFRGGDEEDLDLATLEGVLVMGEKYGDKREDWAKTRDEKLRAEVFMAIYEEALMEKI